MSPLDRLPRAVVFDWDNTLVDTWPVIHDSMNAALAAMGHAPWSFDETRERVRRSMREAFPEMFGARWEEARGRVLPPLRGDPSRPARALRRGRSADRGAGPARGPSQRGQQQDGREPAARGGASRLEPVFFAPRGGDRRGARQAGDGAGRPRLVRHRDRARRRCLVRRRHRDRPGMRPQRRLHRYPAARDPAPRRGVRGVSRRGRIFPAAARFAHIWKNL